MIDWLLENKDWLFSGVGVALITSAVVLIRSIRSRRLNRLGPPLVGHYETFHLHTGQAAAKHVIRSVAEIKKDVFGRHSIRLESFGYRYAGSLDADGKNIYFPLVGLGHRERVMMIFCEPLSPEFDILPGVFAAVTEKWEPSCGKILARKVPTRSVCERIALAHCDSRIVHFLSDQSVPVHASKVQPPKFSELPSRGEKKKNSMSEVQAPNHPSEPTP